MKLNIDNIKEIKDFINSLPDTDIYISESKVTPFGNSAKLPMPKAWEGKRVRYLVVEDTAPRKGL